MNIFLSVSTSPASYWNVDGISLANTFETIRFATPADTTGVNISTGAANAVYAKVSGTELIFSSNFPILNTDQGMSRVFNTDMHCTFDNCYSLNQNILIPNSVTNLYETFDQCYNLNQNILIPNSVTGMDHAFSGCNNFNQNILIPNSVIYMSLTFEGCSNLNQNILIPNSVTDLTGVFSGCNSLNQNDIYIYSQNIENFYAIQGPGYKAWPAFRDVQYIGNIHVPTSVPKETSNFMYNCLINGDAGYTFAPENIINDLPVDIAVWPPES